MPYATQEPNRQRSAWFNLPKKPSCYSDREGETGKVCICGFLEKVLDWRFLFSSLFLILFLCRSTLWHINWNFVGLLNGCAHALSQRSRLWQATGYPRVTCLWFNASCLNCSACALWPTVNRLALERYSTLIFLLPASAPAAWGLRFTLLTPQGWPLRLPPGGLQICIYKG